MSQTRQLRGVTCVSDRERVVRPREGRVYRRGRLRKGRFELAEGGTLFLNEAGELPMELQGKLLRVLQEGEFERVRSSQTRKANVRIIAATNRPLLRDVAAVTLRAGNVELSPFP